MSTEKQAKNEQKIVVRKDGPYEVHGNVPLVRKVPVVSEHGEPLTWQRGEEIEAGEVYELCRCGQSNDKPFCDNRHRKVGFDGTETADPGLTADRQVTYEGGQGIVVKRDYALCMSAGFCGNRRTNIKAMTPQTGDTQVRAQVMAMAERCPSGSYTYALTPDGEDVEPDLPRQVAVVTEMSSEGPITGPLWVTGGIPVERADGQPLETRNRVTLCRCGESQSKPLCDGRHRTLGIPAD
ncbi:MAG: CDGSH iron-sulfur domain-containing protein [Anaerolineae bacterium]